MRKVPHQGTVLGRANDLLDAWLKGMNEGGHTATIEDIKEVFLVSLARAKRESETVVMPARLCKRTKDEEKLRRAARRTLHW